MLYQIRNWSGSIVDRNLTYEEALMWIDCSIGKYYIIEPMKGEK